jgi:penicillin-binding protein 2
MFIFNLLIRDDRRLRIISVIIASGLFVLLAGLWFVQIVFAGRFETNSRKQSLKRVGIPAIRGRILDRHGQVLADSRPRYNAILYLEDLQGQFDQAYKSQIKAYGQENPTAVQSKGRVLIPAPLRDKLHEAADCEVVSNITFQVGQTLQETRILNTNAFLRHYASYPYVPFEIVPDLTDRQRAEFAEQLSGQPDLELETEPVRNYPNGALAAHVLGFVQREFVESEEISYTLPDFAGKTGVERAFDSKLRGRPGIKTVLVNSMNYRQREDIEAPNAPGDDIYLTIDLGVQRAAEAALARAQPNARGAAVVMDCRNGDILTMASIPAYDPNSYVAGLTPSEMEALTNAVFTPQINRAIDGAYPPGSTFKVFTGIACLESGLDPNEIFDSIGYFQASPRAKRIGDTAGPGKFDFKRAFYRSSNTYFIHYGKEAGLKKILEVARRFHLGEKTDFLLHPEVAGNVPRQEDADNSLPLSSTPDVCIGQEITTTPLQMACAYAALANGGKIFWPRLASHCYSPETGQDATLGEPGRLRDVVRIRPQDLELIRSAMLEDTENLEGTAYARFHSPKGEPLLPNFRVAGKTGTAEVKSAKSNYAKVTWFTSYAPYENPRYVVVVMVEGGSFGGVTCAPVAEKIYEALIKSEQSNKAAGGKLAMK